MNVRIKHATTCALCYRRLPAGEVVRWVRMARLGMAVPMDSPARTHVCASCPKKERREATTQERRQ